MSSTPESVGSEPRTGSRRTVLIVVAIVAGVLVLALVACALVAALVWRRDTDDADRWSYRGSLKTTIRIDPVTRLDPQPCRPGGGGTPARNPDEGCYFLGTGGLTVTKVTNIRTTIDNGRPALILELEPADAAAFRTLSRANIDKQVALVVGGRVVTAPQISQEIPGRSVQISGNFTKADTEKLFDQLTRG